MPLVATLFDQYRQFYGRPSDPSGAERFVGERVLRDESVVFAALSGFGPRCKALGFVQLYPTYSSVWMQRVWILNDLFVEEASRRFGIARSLLKHAAHFAKQDGAKRLVLSTAADNAPAKAIYASLGWKKDEKFEHFQFELA